MARAAAKPKTTAAKPAAKPHAAKPAATEPMPPEPAPPADEPPVEDAAETEDDREVEELLILIDEPEPEPYSGPISPTPPHLIRMTHPTGGTSDGFQTDESGAILVPVAQVGAMEGHGFVVDHLPQPEAV